MMRRPAILLLIAACSFTVGLCLLHFYAEYNYRGHNSLYRFVVWLGLLLLFAGLVLTLIVYVRWSFKLRPPPVLFLGVGSIGVAWGLLRILAEMVSFHSWNFVLLALPLVIFLGGAVALVVGGVRLMKKYMEAQYK